VIISDEIEKSDDLCPNDSPIFDYVFTDGLELDYAKVGLDAHLPPSKAEDEPSAFNKDSLGDRCMFARVLMYLPPKDGVEYLI